MKTFVVDSAILHPGTDPKTCVLGTPQMLMKSGVKVKSCYCCGP